MSKKITLRGKDYLKKKLCEIIIASGGCAFKKHREMAVYDNGIVMIKMDNGVCKCVATDNTEETFRILFYDTDGTEDEILFANEGIERGWKAIFVYLFDDQGALLLYAHRTTLPIAGARAYSGDEWSYLEIKSEAFNVAELFQEGLVDKLRDMESVSEERDIDVTLLSVEEQNEE